MITEKKSLIPSLLDGSPVNTAHTLPEPTVKHLVTVFPDVMWPLLVS